MITFENSCLCLLVQPIFFSFLSPHCVYITLHIIPTAKTLNSCTEYMHVLYYFIDMYMYTHILYTENIKLYPFVTQNTQKYFTQTLFHRYIEHKHTYTKLKILYRQNSIIPTPHRQSTCLHVTHIWKQFTQTYSGGVVKLIIQIISHWPHFLLSQNMTREPDTCLLAFLLPILHRVGVLRFAISPTSRYL